MKFTLLDKIRIRWSYVVEAKKVIVQVGEGPM